MLDETFYLDGIDARSVGIRLQAQIEFSKAVPVVESKAIPGRNGNLIFETGPCRYCSWFLFARRCGNGNQFCWPFFDG